MALSAQAQVQDDLQRGDAFSPATDETDGVLALEFDRLAPLAIVFECAGLTGEWVLPMDNAAGRAIADSSTRDLANLTSGGPFSKTD